LDSGRKPNVLMLHSTIQLLDTYYWKCFSTS